MSDEELSKELKLTFAMHMHLANGGILKYVGEYRGIKYTRETWTPKNRAMTEELKQRIAKEAEEKYPLYTDEEIEKTAYELPRAKKLNRNDRNIDKQTAYISAATLWAERLEAMREEVRQYRDQHCFTEGDEAATRISECDQILYIIDKHLNP